MLLNLFSSESCWKAVSLSPRITCTLWVVDGYLKSNSVCLFCIVWSDYITVAVLFQRPVQILYARVRVDHKISASILVACKQTALLSAFSVSQNNYNDIKNFLTLIQDVISRRSCRISSILEPVESWMALPVITSLQPNISTLYILLDHNITYNKCSLNITMT